MRRDDTPFDRAVDQVRSGRPADEEARSLLRDCTESEKLGLLDGDEPFWPGMPRMIGVGYNLEPIVAGEADYVVGSRFRGEIGRMLRTRRCGNNALTVGLRLVARVPLTDGQSGFRALSAPAAVHAEVIHDYHFALELTLDLLAKGFRYAEVPISYSFRSRGSSFVRPFEYVRNVIPAVARQLATRPSASMMVSR